MPRKRPHDEMVSSDPAATRLEDSMTHKLRNMWEFAALYEWMHLFGSAVKLQPIDIEDFEAECLKPQPNQFLEEMGLTILKFVSSRRDLTLDNWDETVRRQYEYKTDGKPHPYGDDEDSVNKFRDFHLFTKLRVLYQLAVWTFHNPDRIRQHFSEYKEQDMFYEWQAHPVGWDRHDKTYYALQGNRLYRRTDPPLPEPEQKKKAKYTSKKAQAARRRERSSKRRKLIEEEDENTEMIDADETFNGSTAEGETNLEETIAEPDPEDLNTFGDYRWECVALDLDGFNSFVASIAKSKDPNERNLKAFVEEEMMPELVKAQERRERKEQERLRELQMAERMIGAKRSGRLAAKQEREKEEAEAAEQERQRQTLLAEARKEEENKYKLENERRSRMLTREQRIKEREYKRVLMEEQLARDSEEEQRLEAEGGARGSRQLKERIKKQKQELEEWDGDEWSFDCSGCGQHGKNFDDGEHSIACERCNVWQHSKCLGFSKNAAEKDDFHFICGDCKQREEEANRPKISLKFKVGQSSSPPQQPASSPRLERESSPVKQRMVSVDIPSLARPSVSGSVVNGQFYPAQDSVRPTQSASQPTFPVTQPSLPAYAQKQVNKAIPYMNGAPPHQYSQYTSYQPQPPHQHPTYPSPPSQHPPMMPSPHQQLPPRPNSSHMQTPRPGSSHSLANGHSSPVRQRLPSPIVNRPTMSPTQGNPEVGPIAGVPGSSPSLQPATIATPYTNGHHYQPNGSFTNPAATPTQNPSSLSRTSSFSASQAPQPMSGLSPTKPRTSASPLPQPSLVPTKQRQSGVMTPSSSFNENRMRSVSGTPIFPPAENLAPSPQQLNREPVPTPSKQTPPLGQGSFQSQGSFQNQPAMEEKAGEERVQQAKQVTEQTVR